MKSKFLLSVLSIFLLSCSSLKNLDAFKHYKHQPKLVESATYKITGNDKDDFQKEYNYGHLYEFDEKGRLIAQMNYGSEKRDKHGGFNFEYDKTGRLIKKEKKNKQGKLNSINTNTYGKREKVSIWHKPIEGGADTLSIYYSKDKKLAHSTFRSDETQYNEDILSRYNEQGKEISATHFNMNGEMIKKSEWSHIREDLTSEHHRYNGDGTLVFFLKSTYDKNHTRILEEHYEVKDGDTTLVKTVRVEPKYDEFGNLIESIRYVDGVAKTIREVKYVYW